MAEVLVVVEHAEGSVKKVTFEALTLAKRLGEPAAVVLGVEGSAAALADSLAGYGASKIYAVESADVDGYLVAPKAEAVAQLIEQAGPAAVLFPASQEGKEIAGRVAVKTGSGLLTDVTNISDTGEATQPIFAGAVIVESKVAKGTPLYTVRPNSVAPEESQGSSEVTSVDFTPSDAAKLTTITDRKVESGSARPELTEAAIVVSGGRGVGSEDNFSLIEGLADTLGAAVGASRAAVDSGFYPHQFQVGQTGKTVSPQLYMAIGISGAIQHRAGMQTSKTIVAVNKDDEAPIFELADYGVVGDLFNVVPQATEGIKQRKG